MKKLVKKKQERWDYLPFKKKVLEKVWNMFVQGIPLQQIAAWNGINEDDVEQIIDSIV